MAPRPPKFERPRLSDPPIPWKDKQEVSSYKITQFSRLFGEKGALFLLSPPDFDDDNDAWDPVRTLGSGGFGHVGLWVKRDKTNRVVDEVAIKEALRICKDGKFPCEPTTMYPGLTTEGIIQAQLNISDCESIVHLRRYKTYPKRPDTLRPRRADHLGKIRMYLEYAPHGTLSQLKNRYQAWDSHLPEVFIWYVFCSLAEALVVMMENPKRKLLSQNPYPPGWGTVHLDLKPANVFIGYEPEVTPRISPVSMSSRYPSVKVGDFGLADVTGPGDINNPGMHWATGTKGYKPPEQLRYGWRFQKPVNGKPWPSAESDQVLWARDPGYFFGYEHNVYAAGRIVYDLITLGSSRDFEKKTNTSEQEYYRLSEHNLDGIDVQIQGQQVYSVDLLRTVYECLRPAMQYRPTPEILLKITRRGLANAEYAIQNATGANNQDDDSAWKVYYAKNDINDMPLGKASFLANDQAWANIDQPQNLDPAWGYLKPPLPKWKDYVGKAGIRRKCADGRRFSYRNGKVFFKDIENSL